MRDSIVITLSQSIIKERKGGYKEIVKEWLNADGEKGGVWCYKCHVLPKYPDKVLWVYWVISGRIRWKCKMAGTFKNRTIDFPGQNKSITGNWLIVMCFEPIPKKIQIEMKGFRGFKYLEDGSKRI